MSAADPHDAASAAERIGPGRLVLVMGPSGAGKDTVIAGARAACADGPRIVFARRMVTRPSSAAEEHDSLSEAAFDDALGCGAFALWWRAHGLRYGIPRQIDDDVRAGRTVVCNVSRGIVSAARAHYVNVRTVLVTAPADILSARLAARARESDGPLAPRLQRSEHYAELHPDHVIENIGAPAEATRALLGIINAGVRSEADMHRSQMPR